MNLERHFRPLYRLPCWGVHWEPQLNLSLNFGAPHLEVREPMKSTARSPRARLRFAHRRVTVRGRWWLWLFWSRWTLWVQGLDPVRSTGSAKRIAESLKLLEGQRLTSAAIAAADGRTRFEFDLGAVLDVRELGRSSGSEIWSFYKPDHRVLSVRGDGTYSLGPADEDAKYQDKAGPSRSGGIARR